jgi:hypothetical protein
VRTLRKRLHHSSWRRCYGWPEWDGYRWLFKPQALDARTRAAFMDALPEQEPRRIVAPLPPQCWLGVQAAGQLSRSSGTVVGECSRRVLDPPGTRSTSAELVLGEGRVPLAAWSTADGRLLSMARRRQPPSRSDGPTQRGRSRRAPPPRWRPRAASRRSKTSPCAY